MVKTTTIAFIKQVKQEVSRVSWPKRQEITVTTVMVCILVSVAAVFFVAIDRVLYYIIQKILTFGL
jgi:preprotein translocase subunit SecE